MLCATNSTTGLTGVVDIGRKNNHTIHSYRKTQIPTYQTVVGLKQAILPLVLSFYCHRELKYNKTKLTLIILHIIINLYLQDHT